MFNGHRRGVALASGRGSRLLTLGAALVLLLVSASAAVADSGAEQGEGSLATAPMPLPESQSEFERLLEGSQRFALEPETDPSAAEELPRSGLERVQAEELLESVFPSALEGPAQELDELEVEAFRSDYVAVVAPPKGSGESSAGLLLSKGKSDEGKRNWPAGSAGGTPIEVRLWNTPMRKGSVPRQSITQLRHLHRSHDLFH